MKETDNLKLKLPEENDWADVGALNENFRALDRAAEQTDRALEGKAEKAHTHASGDITGLDEAMAGALDEKADKGHTHTVSEIRDFPSALPASDVYDWAKQPGKPAYSAGEVGAQAVSTAINTGNIGSQTVNKAKYASITAPGTASLKNIQASTTDLTAGSSALTTGDIYLVYE